MNAAIEIHDTELAAVVTTQNGVIVRLAPQTFTDPFETWLRCRFRAGLSAELLFAFGWSRDRALSFLALLTTAAFRRGVEFRGDDPAAVVVDTVVGFEVRNFAGDLVVIAASGWKSDPLATRATSKISLAGSRSEPTVALDGRGIDGFCRTLSPQPAAVNGSLN